MSIRIVVFVLLVFNFRSFLYAQKLPITEEIRIKNQALELYSQYSYIRTLDDFIDKEVLFDLDAQIVNECIIHPDYLKPIATNEFVDIFDIQGFLNPPGHNESFAMNSLPSLISQPTYEVVRNQEDNENKLIKGSLEIDFFKIVKNRYSVFYKRNTNDKEIPISFSGQEFDRKLRKKLDELKLPELVDTLSLKMIVSFKLKYNTFNEKIQFARLEDDYSIREIVYVNNSKGSPEVLLVEPSLEFDDKVNLGFGISRINSDSNFQIFKYHRKNNSLEREYPVFHSMDVEFGNTNASVYDSVFFSGGRSIIRFPHLMYYSTPTIKKWRMGPQFISTFQRIDGLSVPDLSLKGRSVGVDFYRRLTDGLKSKGGFFEYQVGINVTSLDFQLTGENHSISGNEIDGDGDSYIRNVAFSNIQFKANPNFLGLNTGFTYWRPLSRTAFPFLLGIGVNIGYGQTFEPIKVNSTSDMLISGVYPQYFNVNFNTTGIEDFGKWKNKYDFLLNKAVSRQNANFLLSLRKIFQINNRHWALGLSGGLSQIYFLYAGDTPVSQISGSRDLYPGSFSLSKSFILQGVYSLSLIRVFE